MADVTLAVSEDTFQRAFDLLVRNITFAKSDSVDFGPFSAGYDVAAHLEGGSVDLRADNTVQIKELDLRWDRLRFTLGLDIPSICVGGGCVDLPWPLPDFCLPRVCIFTADPDVSIAVDLASFVAQEVSVTGSVLARYWDPSAVPPGFDPCALVRSLLSGVGVEPFPNRTQWHIHLDPETVDIDLFDFADIVGDLIEDALTDAITALLPGGALRDLALAIIGSVADLIRDILDIPDDIGEWVSDLFNVSFGLFNLLTTIVLEVFAHCVPVHRIDDPLEVLPASDGLIPVRIPIRNLSVRVDDVEMTVRADVGA